MLTIQLHSPRHKSRRHGKEEILEESSALTAVSPDEPYPSVCTGRLLHNQSSGQDGLHL